MTHPCRRSAVALAWTALVLGGASAALANPARIAAALASEAVDVAARVSGRALGPAARQAAREAVERAAIRYGDDALRAARTGGIELTEAAATHGDDVWRLAAACPEGSRALALRPAEILPLARRVGPDVLRLEAKAPGLAGRACEAFGDGAVHRLAADVPAGDLPRLVGLAGRADSPRTARLLLDTYAKAGPAFLDRLNWKHIMAFGLSAAAVTAAYKTSDGIQGSLGRLAATDPDAARKTILGITGQILRPWILGGSALGIGWALLKLRAWGLFRRRATAPPATPPD